MNRHLDDADLLAVASGLRLADDPLVRHTARCPVCRRRLEALTPLMPAGGQPVELPPVPAVRRRRRGVPALGAAAALVLALLVAGPRIITGQGPWGVQAALVWVTGRNATLTPVRAASGHVQVRWSRAAGWALLTAYDLPPLPRHHVYEAWWIVGTRHVRAGVFVPQTGGTATVWLPSRTDFAHVDGVGITAEPAPGTLTPTGPREYIGPLKS